MVKHIVFFKIKEDVEDKLKAVEFIINSLSALKNQISEIKFYELGINFAERESAYDIALVSQFENKIDLQIYREHPLHKQVVEQIKPLISKTAVVDYEI